MNIKFRYSFIFLIILTFAACSDRKKLKRKIDGTYEIVKMEQILINKNPNQCSGESTFVNYSIDNPGKLKFTGKKTVQGAANSMSYTTYIGYMEYDFEVTNYFGNTIKMDEPFIFQYDFATHQGGNITAGKDSIQAHIYIDRIEYDLEIEEMGKKITKFSYTYKENSCYTIITNHYVKL
jgi:hypothetical protein